MPTHCLSLYDSGDSSLHEYLAVVVLAAMAAVGSENNTNTNNYSSICYLFCFAILFGVDKGWYN